MCFIIIFLPKATFDIGSSWSTDANLEEGEFFLGHRQGCLDPRNHTPETSFQIYQVLQSAIFLTTSLSIYGDKSCPVKAFLTALLGVPRVPRIIF